MENIRWGILSTAKIGREKVIPALQKGQNCKVMAIASRNEEQAKTVAKNLQIPKAYGSYEALLKDSEIDAVYIPLPNHLHVDWAIKSLEAGKHVLCEKPLGTSVADAKRLLHVAAEKPQLKVMEAFMYRFHPQWQFVQQQVAKETLGELKAIQSFFSYYNVDMNNIRNRKDAAGGGLMDIGCYCISWSRWLFGAEPEKVVGLIENDPRSHTDRLSSGFLHFLKGTSSFTCSTQLMPYQRVNLVGTDGRMEIEVPVNAPPEKPSILWVHTKAGSEKMVFDAVDQYTLQAEAFAQAIINNTAVPISLQDSIKNMKVLESLFESAAKNSWINLTEEQNGVE